eukprot:3496579-Rhodomonas_salina.2
MKTPNVQEKVPRGHRKTYCVLFLDSTVAKRKRLKVIAVTFGLDVDPKSRNQKSPFERTRSGPDHPLPAFVLAWAVVAASR